MNDPRPPLTDDELSARLDGEAPPDVAARIAADPAAGARLEQLRGAAAVGGTPVAPLDPAVVDDLVARAIGAGIDVGATEDPNAREPGAGVAPGGSVVIPLTRSRRSGPSVLVAAVVLVLVAAGLGLVWSGTHSGGTSDTAATAGKAERQADEAAPEAGGDVATDADGVASTTAPGATGAGSGGAAPTTLGSTASYAGPGVDLPDLGTFDTPEALRASLASAFPTSVPTGRAATDAGDVDQAGVDRCAGLLVEVLPVTGDPTHVGFARVGGDTVLVYEFATAPESGSTTTTVAGPSGTTLTTAVRPQACDPLFVFQR